jgi:hypothetical protein
LTTLASIIGRRGLPPNRAWLRLPESGATDPVVKPAPYLPIYEQVLGSLRRKQFTLVELGVWNGDSLKMWRDGFPRATIIGIDISPPELDLGDRVHIVQGDQADAALMRRVRTEHAPGGFDVVIDDASHLGITTARSLQALYLEHLRWGGLYFIEDWGTGYVPSWHDGGQIASLIDVAHLDNAQPAMVPDVSTPIAMASHDVGLVGLVKRIIDHVASGTVRAAQPDAVGDVLPTESLTIWDGIVLLRKPAA